MKVQLITLTELTEKVGDRTVRSYWHPDGDKIAVSVEEYDLALNYIRKLTGKNLTTAAIAAAAEEAWDDVAPTKPSIEKPVQTSEGTFNGH